VPVLLKRPLGILCHYPRPAANSPPPLTSLPLFIPA